MSLAEDAQCDKGDIFQLPYIELYSVRLMVFTWCVRNGVYVKWCLRGVYVVVCTLNEFATVGLTSVRFTLTKVAGVPENYVYIIICANKCLQRRRHLYHHCFYL